MKAIHVNLLLFVAVWWLAGCIAPPPAGQPTGEPGIPNPASVYCEEHGGRLVIRTDEEGGQYGVCTFPDGSECEEWAYFRDECKPGDVFAESGPTAGPVETQPSPSVTAEVAGDGWNTYHNAELGYEFRYPTDTEIVIDDNAAKSISIVGSLAENENWPQITISHPRDLEEFRPPEDANLLQWLTDHNLMGDDRMPDVEIAGTTGIHFRHERSPQSYAFDRYYFAKAGQLYMVVIGHVGDKEDWELYNNFLQSIRFVEDNN